MKKCSFCHKTQQEVATLIVGGDDISICNECTTLCAEQISKSVPTIKNPTMDITEESFFCLTLRYYKEAEISNMFSWLETNVKNAWINNYIETDDLLSYKIIFENQSDLVAFKLRWL
jgi:hypothetical protein